jgi:hypothetical protein
MKHLQHMSETVETLAKHPKTLESHCKRMHYTDKTLKTYTCNMHVMQHPDILLQHPDKTLKT